MGVSMRGDCGRIDSEMQVSGDLALARANEEIKRLKALLGAYQSKAETGLPALPARNAYGKPA